MGTIKFRILLLISFFVWSENTRAGRISGTVGDERGNPLPFASILVKGTITGTTANNEGKYFLELPPGNYIISCQYVGYKRSEKAISWQTGNVVLDFTLSLQPLTLAEVVIKPGAEDPAYEIIRNAIKKRNFYLNQLKAFQCQVYIKGQLRLRSYPKKFLGEKIDFEDGDTSQQKMIYLSETVANYSVQKPAKSKIEVISSKVSGQSNGFGLSAPQILSFYENILQVGTNLNPRGFVSPIANTALRLYKYKYEGSFFEDGKEINRIKVVPRRKYEPVFSGIINITEGDWRIHSVQLILTSESQLQIVDTLRIEQLYVPFDNNTWVIKSQVIYPSVKKFGFDAYGSFVNIYSRFDINPIFARKFFGNTFLKFYDSANKKPSMYWDSIRPMALQQDEMLDYHKKDSLENARKDPRYLDSLDRKRNKVNGRSIIVSGIHISRSKNRIFYNISPLFESLTFNTVEGVALNLSGSYFKRLDSTTSGSRSIMVSPFIRYGFGNDHLNAGFTGSFNYGRKYFTNVFFGGGKDIFQFNNASPIKQKNNTISTLLFEKNYMKIYEAWFARLGFSKGIGEGLTFSTSFEFQDRRPLENTTTTKWRDRAGIEFTPNFPAEAEAENMLRHQAFRINASLNWRPGGRYIELPERKINIGSRYPILTLSYAKGIPGFLGSDIKYDKWRLGMSDNLNLKLGGQFSYRVSTGGFLNRKKVQLPDFQHVNGNQLILASPYLASYQLAPYYRYSNIERWFTTLFAEHHFNGLLTNKIPLFRKLNWNLIAGANALFINRRQNYFEVCGGVENIFKLFRVDVIRTFEYGAKGTTGIRIGIKGAFLGN